jgi:hypothetical protein
LSISEKSLLQKIKKPANLKITFSTAKLSARFNNSAPRSQEKFVKFFTLSSPAKINRGGNSQKWWNCRDYLTI